MDRPALNLRHAEDADTGSSPPDEDDGDQS
jgi:hypothetical protein